MTYHFEPCKAIETAAEKAVIPVDMASYILEQLVRSKTNRQIYAALCERFGVRCYPTMEQRFNEFIRGYIEEQYPREFTAFLDALNIDKESQCRHEAPAPCRMRLIYTVFLRTVCMKGKGSRNV